MTSWEDANGREENDWAEEEVPFAAGVNTRMADVPYGLMGHFELLTGETMLLDGNDWHLPREPRTQRALLHLKTQQ